MKTSTKSLKIAFDNAGGVVLFGRHYAYIIDDGKQLAADVICLLAGGDVRQWDGNNKALISAMRRSDLSGYENVYTVGEIAGILAGAYVKVDEDNPSDVTVKGRSISGYTERRFWQHVSAR